MSVLSLSIAGGAQTGGVQPAPTGVAPALSINHWQVHVSDLKQSQEFYSKLLGARVIDTSGNTWTSKIPDANVWLSLTKAQGTDPTTGLSSKPGMFELGIGIELTPKNAGHVRSALKQALPMATIVSPGTPGAPGYDRVIYVDHPDGIRLRLVSSKDDGHLLKADRVPAVPRTPRTGVVTMRNFNHINVTHRDGDASVAFYSTVLGATVRERAANGRGATMTVAGGPFWLRFGIGRDPAKVVSLRQPIEGNIDHPGLGIEITPDTADALRAKITAAFPNNKVYSPGTPAQDIYTRSIYIVDPDGLLYQMIGFQDAGELPNLGRQPRGGQPQ
jgi:catechol 2,3-dioxygenase-like lactoylglutathione lyase family enzyme